MRIAVFGCGFWSQYQVAGWRELPGAEVVALYNRTRARAEALAARFGIAGVYDDPEALLQHEKIDVIDIITDVETHPRFVHLAAGRGLPVICQKPMASSLEEAEGMVAACQAANVPFLVHENWRWQAPLRALRETLLESGIGPIFRAQIDFINGFPVFRNQPFLKQISPFILADIGTHLLDAARFLFGEATTVYCQTQKVHRDIAGEDVATVMMKMAGPGNVPEGATVVCNMAYAENHLEHDRFPETFVFAEGERGSIELGPDYWVRVTTASGTHARRCPPPRFAWADPAYEVVQSSIVPCCANLLAGLRGEEPAETTGVDNLRTLRIVFAAHRSAATGEVLTMER